MTGSQVKVLNLTEFRDIEVSMEFKWLAFGFAFHKIGLTEVEYLNFHK